LLCDALKQEGAAPREYSIKRLLFSNGPDFVHIHWPEGAIAHESMQDVARATRRLFFGLKLALLRGARIVWTVHNAHPHDRYHPEIEPEFYRKLLKFVHGLVFLSETSRALAVEQIPELAAKPYAVIPHGHYRPVLRGGPPKSEARKRLGLPEKGLVLACIGSVRDYKNVPALVRAFRAAAKPSERLAVAGNCADPVLKAEVETESEGDDRILLHLERLDNQELETYHRAADLAVTPYTEILNSGSLLYALSCGVPFLGPEQGSLAEVRERVGAEWVRLYEGSFDERTLRRAMDEIEASPPKGEPDLSSFDWPGIAKEMMAFYRSLLPRASKRKPRPISLPD
jgi:glycosyltransferase involved in cell wall biosynthesis